MRKFLYSILGIEDLKSQVNDLNKTFDDLKKTIASMQEQLTAMHASYNLALEIVQVYEKSDKNIPWYEDETILRDAEWDVRQLAYRIQDDKKRQLVYTHPALKKKISFHGGCYGCTTPLKESLASCKGCYYFHSGANQFPDLSKKYAAETISK